MDDVKRHSLKTGIRDGTEYVLAADYDRLRRELAEARELLREARDRIGCGCVGGSDAGLCCVCDDRIARIDAAMAEPKEVPK